MTGKAMIYLFSPDGIAELRNFIDNSTLFAFDLDGTLAPIIADPANIAIPYDVRSRLLGLQQIAPVAVVTGRSCADALKHLGFVPDFLAGNHGAEGLPDCEELESEYVRLCCEWKQQLGELLPDGNATGIVLEDKGASLTLHYRNATNRKLAHAEILQAISRLEPPPRSGSGIFVESISPQAAPHKGGALRRIMEHLGCSRALFVGDDVTDENVFLLGDSRIMGIRVGISTGSAAAYYLRDQGEIGALLDRIMEAITAGINR